ncbi:MAG: hypothetical protein ACR2IR_12680 [Acidimicrobiia bacterium]
MSAMGFLDLTVPEHAYMFGFLQGDGSLKAETGQKGQLTVELSVRDTTVLEKFQRLLPFSSSLRTRTRDTNFSKRYTSIVWTVNALKFREELIELGLPVGRKSTRVRPPSVAFSTSDYLRGLVDADGSVGFRKRGRLPFVGITTASAAIKDFFIQSCPDDIGRPRKSRRNSRDAMFNPMASQEAAVGLARTLYYDGCLGLDRKLLAARRVEQWVRPAGMKVMNPRAWESVEDAVLFQGSVREVALLLGRTEQSVSLRRWRLRDRQRVLERAMGLRDPRLYEPL